VSAITNLSDPPTADLTQATATTLARLNSVPVTAPIDTATFLEQTPAELSVGSLDTTQVTGLLAQTKLDVGQNFNTVSLDKGIGAFGFNPSQLEGAGFLKPGTVQTFLQDPAQVETVLRSPSVWTGKSGVGNLGSLLADPDLQSITQNEIMVSALEGLRSLGVVTGSERPQDLAGFVQAASRFGVKTTVDWVQGSAPSGVTNEINAAAKSAQFAVNFVDTRASELIAGGRQLGGFTSTTERGQLDRAITEIIGNDKVSAPNFGQGLFSNTPDAELIYTGDDPIVLERINQERRRRGLPLLALGGSVRT
jgi:hypothetical protein